MSIRIKATDELGNVAYVFSRGGRWGTVLANGIPAGFSYAGIWGDEMAAVFCLEDCSSAEEALAVCERMGSPRTKYEIFKSTQESD
jgi:hypothetical protein